MGTSSAANQKIVKYERMCASEGEATIDTCTHAPVGTDYKPSLNSALIGGQLEPHKASAEYFTCTKVCTSGNCNAYGVWPGRPSCHQCSTTGPSDISCLAGP